MHRLKPNVSCRGFSITRLEGIRWCLRRTRSGYGESTSMRVEVGGRRAVSEAATRTLGGDAAVIGLRFWVKMGDTGMEKGAVLASRHRSAQACESTSKSLD